MKPSRPYYDKPRTAGPSGRTSGGGAHLDAPPLRRRSPRAEGADAYQDWLAEQEADALTSQMDRLRRQAMSTVEASEIAETYQRLNVEAVTRQSSSATEELSEAALLIQVDRIRRQVMSTTEASEIADTYERLHADSMSTLKVEPHR